VDVAVESAGLATGGAEKKAALIRKVKLAAQRSNNAEFANYTQRGDDAANSDRMVCEGDGILIFSVVKRIEH